jgi:hypothetical protein
MQLNRPWAARTVYRIGGDGPSAQLQNVQSVQSVHVQSSTFVSSSSTLILAPSSR